MVQVRSTQQEFLPSSVRWLPTNLQHADALTKIDPLLMDRMRRWLQKPWAQLVEARDTAAWNKDQCEKFAI